MDNFAITAADAVSRRYKSNDPEAIIVQFIHLYFVSKIIFFPIPCTSFYKSSIALSM